MIENLTEFLKELKTLKTGAKMSGLIIALLGVIIDLLLLSNGIHTSYYLKSIYISIGAVSIILIVNDFCTKLEERKNKREKEIVLINSIRRLQGAERKLLHKFYKSGSLNIKLEDDEDLETAFCLRQILNGRIGIMSDRAVISAKTLELIEKAFS